MRHLFAKTFQIKALREKVDDLDDLHEFACCASGRSAVFITSGWVSRWNGTRLSKVQKAR